MPCTFSTIFRSLPLACLAVFAAAGCERTPSDPVGSEMLRPEGTPRATNRILLAQTVTAAGEDAMLYDHHFDGIELNSLGMAKLRLMLEDAGFIADPKVYVVSASTEQLAAVRRYLGQWGVAFDDASVQAGPNPAMRRPAALGQLQQQKLEEASAQPTGQASGTSTTSGN